MIGQDLLKEDVVDEVIMAFEDFNEYGEDDIEFSVSQNDGYDYSAFIKNIDATQFCLVTEDSQDSDGEHIKLINAYIA